MSGWINVSPWELRFTYLLLLAASTAARSLVSATYSVDSSYDG